MFTHFYTDPFLHIPYSTQEVLLSFLGLFLLQRSHNVTIEKLETIHKAGIHFMETAKKHLPERNGARNPDGSQMGWAVWKFHAILHKAMDLMLYGWSENTSTQCSESAHKVIYLHIFTHIVYTVHERCRSRRHTMQEHAQGRGWRTGAQTFLL